MSKPTPQVPTPADPNTVAKAQTTSNVGTAASQQAGNLINQIGPNGSTSYSQTGSYTDPTTGAATPTYTQSTSLDPLSQAVLNGAKQLSAGQVQNAQGLLPGQQQIDLGQQQLAQGQQQGALQLLPGQTQLALGQQQGEQALLPGQTQLALGQQQGALNLLPGQQQLAQSQLKSEQALLPGQTQLELGQQQLAQGGVQGAQQRQDTLLPAGQTLAQQAGAAATTPLNFNTADSGILNTAPQQLNDQAADAVYRKQATYLDPQFTQSQKNLEDQLSRQGIPIGSEAYSNAMQNFGNVKNQAYGAARDSATAGGANSASQMFNMALQGQQQNISQQQLAQNNPLQLLGQLLNGTGK